LQEICEQRILLQQPIRMNRPSEERDFEAIHSNLAADFELIEHY
jgi:hypothetical protein